MHSASSFDGNGSPFGTHRVLTQFPDEHIWRAQNSSHIQEAYQNLPQLQKAIYLPLTYKAYESQNIVPYSEQQQQQSTVSPQWHSKLPTFNHKLHFAKRHYEQELAKEQAMHKREGWGWGGGGGDAGHHHKGNSAALSALALLGFMFFLQLIQMSLQNNRQMLATAAPTAAPAAMIAGRANIYRQKRDIRGYHQENHTIPEFAVYDREIQNMIHTNKPESNQYQVEFASDIPTRQKNNFSSSSTTHNQKLARNPIHKTTFPNNPLEILQSSSVHCCQLLACKIGKSIYDNLDTTSGFMIRMLGTTMIPRIPKKTWTGRLLRALDKGWKLKECDNLYRNCGVLHKLFNGATKAIQKRKARTKTRH